jgi:hypothetical protein
VAELDERVLLLETKHETLRQYVDGEIASLRSSRHEHGNWLNRHNLEISAVSQRLEELFMQRLTATEKGLFEVRTIQEEHGKAISSLVSDMKVLAWKIGVILAVLVFLANQLASRIHF